MKIILLISCTILLISCQSSPAKISTSGCNGIEEVRVMFYNVENLFDTYDEPGKDDDFFTPDHPEGKWTEERYTKKLDNLGKVIEAAFGKEEILFIGLAEIENNRVLEDLIATEPLNDFDLGIAHKESADNRGIDVALLYNKEFFSIEDLEIIRMPFDFEPGKYTSRDILQVEGDLCNGEKLYVFVNHWPSRRGGLAASSPRREHVASYLKKELDDIFKEEGSANVILMGDFNDETDNKSITKVLGALSPDKIGDEGIYNLMIPMDRINLGTYNYRGNWNMLDQFMVSTNLLSGNGSIRTSTSEVEIIKEDFMMFNHPKNGETPNRTYGGPNYYGGYSDHLPIILDLKID